MIVTSELSLWGYPPQDFLLYPDWIERSEKVLRELARRLADRPPVIVGFAERGDFEKGEALFSAAALLRDGNCAIVARKALLPNYGVFNENRHFFPDLFNRVFEVGGKRLAVSICEDIWQAGGFRPGGTYGNDFNRHLAGLRFDLMINLSASPFEVGKEAERRKTASAFLQNHGAPLLYCNQVGANDGVVFDGGSFLRDENGEVRLASFEEESRVVECSPTPEGFPSPLPEEEKIRRALVAGVAGYARKNGFSQALLGLSGGVDSALVCCLASQALGAGNVLPVMMPSPFSSRGSVADALALVENLGLESETLRIDAIYRAALETLEGVFAGANPDETEENVQSRIRGLLLMALSNKQGRLLLTTGNKSELAVGYCTLYGDMCGALSVIGDLWKTDVYRLCRWLNRDGGNDPSDDPRQGTLRRIEARSKGRRQSAALRSAGRDPATFSSKNAAPLAKSRKRGSPPTRSVKSSDC